VALGWEKEIEDKADEDGFSSILRLLRLGVVRTRDSGGGGDGGDGGVAVGGARPGRLTD